MIVCASCGSRDVEATSDVGPMSPTPIEITVLCRECGNESKVYMDGTEFSVDDFKAKGRIPPNAVRVVGALGRRVYG